MKTRRVATFIRVVLKTYLIFRTYPLAITAPMFLRENSGTYYN